jgi:phospholipid/cholesterol/gamma-HCH transport system substrate-binding protein
MATKAQKVRLSIFMIASGTVLLVFFLVLVGNRILKRMDWYYVEYQDISVTGLEPGAAVKYHGVQVGRVSNLSLKDAATVLIEIEVERGTPIKKDSEALLSLVGITGLKFVEIIGGSVDAEDLEVGGTIKAGSSMFETISGRAEIILGKLEQVLNNLNIMLSPETTTSIQNALNSIDSLTREVNGFIVDNRDQMDRTVSNIDTLVTRLSDAAEHVNTTVERIDDLVRSNDVTRSVSNVRTITEHIKTQLDSLRLVETIDDFRTFVNNSNEMVVHTDLIVLRTRDNILRSMSNLEEALDNLREATDVIRDDPSVLLRGRQTSTDRIE